MELNYIYVESTVKPEAFEIDNDMVYIRKDISSITRTHDEADEPITYWIYQEAVLTDEAYINYTNYILTRNAINGADDSTNIVRIINNQETADSNQLAIMEAMAELYEMIAVTVTASE